tara:strand:- start:456 stop:842 length:387 start_codon:yes stop_codon:yes gene_type:complete
MIGFGQDKNLKKSKFNFNKSNNYGSNIKSDADKVCKFTTQIMEMMPQMIQLSLKASFGDENSKKETRKELNKLQASFEKITKELESIIRNGKYDKEEWQTYLLENCEAAKEMSEMGKAFQAIGNVAIE